MTNTTPLNQEQQQVVLAEIQKIVDVNNGWFNCLMGIRAARQCIPVIEPGGEEINLTAAKDLADLAEHLADAPEQDFGFPMTQEQAALCLLTYTTMPVTPVDQFLFVLQSKAEPYIEDDNYYNRFLEAADDNTLKEVVEYERCGYGLGWDSDDLSLEAVERMKPYILKSIAEHPESYPSDMDPYGMLPDWFAEAIEDNQSSAEIEARKWSFCTPKAKGLSPSEYVEAFTIASMSESAVDQTGLWLYLQHQSEVGGASVPPAGPELGRLFTYLCTRFENENSKVAKALLDATTGVEIHEAMKTVLSSGKWMHHKTPLELAKEAQEQSAEPELKPDYRYRLLVIAAKEDWAQSIDGDPLHEGKWVPIRNEATGEDLMRFTAGEPLRDPKTDESIDRWQCDELYSFYGMDLIECCLSPNWADGFDYTPLWEAAVADGSINGSAVSVDRLSAMIKAGQYWPGNRGGYIEQS